ncbi:GNAT family N-acetyltransferase [Acetobacter oeni]|uniref:N-acetyltransferase n=1 Tax=Acetobacter oeni TaxID=304077 RepID=A0A511XNQ7_9PROT|nr:GNAT family N-acetyltransferase [Acetobacter oeni]MBB3884408.1 putative N-acetyltransferase YhbS [Acetobacter oeni]NHO20370.1 GNAT family N-acetyltransferase [Acetobacter oeni]GBR09866.1 N-acetyltransferase GCN5 [Acetobacter oeni LMG 21952]GEN64591.1 N-acetyltransferase [Acetobacter oeni]
MTRTFTYSDQQDTQIAFRPMHPDDLPQAVRLSKDLAWPHRQEDWTQMLGLGHGIVATTQDNAVIGTILWWTWGSQAASLGMIIVSPAWQGHGIGKQLMARARQALPGYTLHLNATSAGVPLYEKSGFRYLGVVEQHQGNVASVPLIPLPEGCRIRPAGAADLDALCAMDAAAKKMNRQHLIRALLSEGRGIIVDSETGILGFSFCRKFGWGQAAGPVVATSENSALAMLAYWAGICTGQFLRVDMPQNDVIATALDEWGLLRVGTVISMTTDPGDALSPAPGDATCFALCGQAYG